MSAREERPTSARPPATAARAGALGALLRFADADGFVGYRSPQLAGIGVPHLFTTRRGARGREHDLGRLDSEQRDRLRSAAGRPRARVVSVKQVHGARALLVRDELPDARCEADALVTELEDVLLCVYVADCVPVLLASADGRSVAAVHAGWRGIVAGALPRAVEVLAGRIDARGGARSGIVAAIGPCISLAQFEVGPEVVAAFVSAGLCAAVRERPGARAHVDLRAAAAEQLFAAGVARADCSDRCTVHDAEEFFSYRRDVTRGGRGSTGRLGALVGCAGPGGAEHAS